MTNEMITVLEDRVESVDDFAEHVRSGLAASPKQISSKYFYDKRGSELFREIMALPEYYLTECEHQILREQVDHFKAALDSDHVTLIDLGAGDGAKTFSLIEGLTRLDLDVQFCPIDISASAIQGLVKRTQESLPKLPVHGVVSEYMSGLEWIGDRYQERRNLVLLLGSNVGNFTRDGGCDFLSSLRKRLKPNDIVCVGFDLKKDPDVLISAYADSQGVTAKFNTNLLERINRELGGNFVIDQFQHYGTYNARLGAMESHLMSKSEQTVFIEALDTSYSFAAWEAIFTERSVKFNEAEIRQMAKRSGLSLVELLFDRKGWFVDALFKVD